MSDARNLNEKIRLGTVAVKYSDRAAALAPLVAAKLLTPLGKPAPNAPKYFAAIEVLACTQNRDWLSHATRAISKHWSKRNEARSATEAAQVHYDLSSS